MLVLTFLIKHPFLKAGFRDIGVAQTVGANGRHHEIYLSDPMKAAPDKLKTILRHPVKP